MTAQRVEKVLWTEQYAVGNETIDQQHQGLFDTYNRLVEATATNAAGNEVEEVFAALVAYIETHFSDEEVIWKKDDAIFQKQHRAHYSFVKMVMTESRKDSGNERVTADLLVFIRDWLVDHIVKQDSQDYQTLQEKGAGVP